jgi:acyl-CoA thioester hydrolase
MTTPLPIFETSVLPEWIDYNGHMNVAYYVLAFDRATDKFLDHCGIGEGYIKSVNHSTFALEAHVNYIQEVHEGDPLTFDVQLLDYDQKRLHFFIRMFHREEKFLSATFETISMHMDMSARRSAVIPPHLLDPIAELMAAHADLPRPEQAGRQMGIRRK